MLELSKLLSIRPTSSRFATCKAVTKMIEFKVVAAEADSVARNRASHYANVKWCRLNDKTVYWAEPDGQSSLPDELRLLDDPPETAKGDLYLVGQMGNAFC